MKAFILAAILGVAIATTGAVSAQADPSSSLSDRIFKDPGYAAG